MAVFDIEGDGLYPTKIHCLVYEDEDWGLVTTTDYEVMREFFTSKKKLIGHNIVQFDIPVVERILGIKVQARLIDTLALSWYLEPKRYLHGLESWGEEFGVKKPEIDDWDNLAVEDYILRCQEDVKINRRLWHRFRDHLLKLYKNKKDADRLIKYLTFKMDCAREQEEVGWKLDVEQCKKSLKYLEDEKERRTKELAEAMPKVPKKIKKTRPKKCFKQSGEPSKLGKEWLQLLEEKGLPEDYCGEVEVVQKWEEPNPNSVPQVKDWLFSLGWKPMSFKYNRNKETGEVKKVEQINDQYEGGLCPSVKQLYDKEPTLEALDGLFVISHRISILKGFLEDVDDKGYIKAGIQGLTNTLRFKHKVVVNLPGIDKPYGKEVRGCLVAPEGMELLGSDAKGLEDRTKQHFMWDYDPEFVKEQLAPDFDPHTNLAVFFGAMTPEEEQAFKNGDTSYKPIRTLYKTVNYTCTYGAGGATTARAAGVSKPEGDRLVEAYWKRNWSIKAIADDCTVKTLRGQKWLYNPVSRFWYSLRSEKDRFSTLNQGTGVYCFDTWVSLLRKKGAKLCGQMHDEVIQPIYPQDREYWEGIYQEAIEKTNKLLNLNRRLDVDIQFGSCYSDIH